MNTSYATLLRIIDLGLLLLMTFFAVADLTTDVQVALPKGSESAPGDVYRVTFGRDMNARVERLPNGETTCRAGAPAGLADCFGRRPQAHFLIEATGRATVQQLVDVLDICEAAAAACSISP